MVASEPSERALITHGEMRRLPDGASVYDQDDTRWVKRGPWWHKDGGERRLLGTELKRLSRYLCVLRPFRPEAYLPGGGSQENRGLPGE